MKRISILLLINILIISCETEENSTTDSTILNSEIIIGKLNPNLTQTRIDTIIEYTDYLEPPHYGRAEFEFLIDVDGDNINDLSFNHKYARSKWGIYYDSTSLGIINSDFEVSSLRKNDTVYYCGFVDTISYPDYPYYDTTFYSENIGFTCEHSFGISSVSNNIYPQIQYLNDTLNKDAFWLNLKEIRLLYKRTDGGGPMFTEFAYNYRYKIKEGLISNPEVQFIIFRKNEGDVYRYGWIKISIVDHSRIYLHEIVFENKV